jgi:hypothetical protein
VNHSMVASRSGRERVTAPLQRQPHYRNSAIQILPVVSAYSYLRFGLDSGIGSPVVYTSGSREPACLIGGAEWTDGRALTLTGVIKTRMGELGALDVGGQAISGLTATLMPRVDPSSQIEDGVLPTALFRSIYFNHRDNYIVLNPRRGFD